MREKFVTDYIPENKCPDSGKYCMELFTAYLET